MGTRERTSRFCAIITPVYPLRPNIWGRVTDGPLFASHHSNVLPAPATMSINGRHVPKHIQHTKRTLWLGEMDCAQDWQETLWMCQSPKALCFTPLQASGTQTLPFVSFVFICIINCFTFGFRRKKSSKTVDLSHTGDYCPTGKSGIHSAQLCTARFCVSANLHISWYADDECRMRGDGHE